jgi:hypothetical protein
VSQANGVSELASEQSNTALAPRNEAAGPGDTELARWSGVGGQ